MNVSRRIFLKSGLSLIVIGMTMPHSLLASSAGIPVLLYHDISNDFTDEYTIAPAGFAAEMEWLYANGYNAISCSDLEKSPISNNKRVIITFDDGYVSFMDYAFPLIQQYGFKATINIIGNKTGSYIHLFGNRPLLSWDEYRFLKSSSLVELGCHSYNLHTRGGVLKVGESAFEKDLEEFQQVFQSEIGRKTDILAWPYGIYNNRYAEIAQKAGIRYLLTSNEGLYNNGNNIGAIPRIPINNKLDLVSFQQYIGEPK